MKRFYFCRLTIFSTSNCLNYFSSVLVMKSVTAFSVCLVWESRQNPFHPVPSGFPFCSLLSGHWVDLNLTFFSSLTQLHCPQQSYSFTALMHALSIQKSHFYLQRSLCGSVVDGPVVPLQCRAPFSSCCGRMRRLHKGVISPNTPGSTHLTNKLGVSSGQVFAFTVHRIQLEIFNLSFIYLGAWVMLCMPCMCYASSSIKLCSSEVIPI